MILGHQKQWQFLKKSFKFSKVSHAYLFCGENGLGKKTIAKEFIKLLECQGENIEKPCEKCSSCLQIQKGFHPDLTIVEPIEGEIKISQVRELSRILNLKPYAAPFKTAIIDGAEKMNQEAANALLKTLEEPSGQAVLILITEHPELLPKTIVSRAQMIKFFPLLQNELKEYLKTPAFAKTCLPVGRATADKQNLSEKEIQELILLSEGKPAKLINFLSDPQKVEEEKNRLEEIKQLSSSDLISRFNYVKKITDAEENINEILERWLRYFRGLLLSSLKPESKSAQNIYSAAKLNKIIKTTENVNSLISSTNVNPRLALEIVMLEL